jgi:hypothetical protein
MIVIDVTNLESLVRLDEWIENIDPTLPKYIVANKIDCERVITTDDIKKKAKEYSIEFKEVSAKNGTHINSAFKDFESSIMTKKKYCIIL